MRAAEVGARCVLTDVQDAAADRAGAREVLEQGVAVAAADGAGELRQVFLEFAQHLQHGVLVVQEHVAPHGRIGRGDAGEVAKAAGGELQHFGLGDALQFVGGADDGVGDQVRQVAGDGEHEVVVLGGHGFDIGAERLPERLQPLDALGVTPSPPA